MSIYVLAVNKIVEKYPHSLEEIRRANPTISFPQPISDEIAAQFNVFPVTETPQPSYDPDTQRVVWVDPKYINNKWVQQWNVESLSQNEITTRLNAWRQGAVCTPFQGKVALHNAGLLATIEALMIDPQTDSVTKLAWNNATEWRRSSPMITSLAAILNLSETQVDNLFKSAATIQA